MNYSEISIHTDGGSRGNPGPSAVGISAESKEKILFEISEYIGEQTNNVSEYTAVIRALRYLDEHQVSSDICDFFLDSQLIVRQITGLYRVKEPHLQKLLSEVFQLIRQLKEKKILNKIQFLHVLRHQNKRADQLVNQALDAI